MWTIQQTELIPIAGNVIESKSLTLLNPAKPGMLVNYRPRLNFISFNGSYLEPTRGTPMLKSSILRI